MPGNRDVYEQAMNAGHNAAWDQDWKLAVASYSRAIQEIPEDPEAHIHLGLALLEMGRLEEALKVYSRAHQLSPGDPIPLEKSADVLERMGRQREAAQQYISVADIYFQQRDYDKTISNWERATRLTPGLLPIHAKLAQLRERIGDNKGAVRDYLILAASFQRAGDKEKAEKAVERAAKLDATNRYVTLAVRAVESGQDIAVPPDEEMAVEKVEDSAGGRPARVVGDSDPLGPMGEAMTDALGLLAMHVMESGQLDAAGGDALLAMEMQRQGQHEQAIEAYLRAENRLRHPALKLNLGVLLLLAGRADEAIKHLGEAAVNETLAAGAFHALGLANVKVEKPKQAARFLMQSAQEADSSLAESHEEIMRIQALYEVVLEALNHQTTEALTAINRRFSRLLEGKDWKRRLIETRHQLEEIMRMQGVQGVLDILVSSPGDELSDALSNIDRYIRQGLLNLAMDEAQRAIEYSPGFLPVHLRMAEIMIREGRVRNAITKFNVVARTYLVRGEFDRASAILSSVLEMAPLDISVRQTLIDLLQAQERWDDVIDQYIELADAYHQLGNFEQSRDTFALAERTAQRMNASPRKMADIKFRIADIDQMRLDLRKAQKTYEEVIQLVPDDERAYKALIELNFRQNNQLEAIRRLDQLLGVYARSKQITKITQMLEEQVKQYPNETQLRNRLAAIYRELGRKQDAINQLEALWELQLEAGLPREAAQTIRRIIDIGPERVENYRRLLAELGG